MPLSHREVENVARLCRLSLDTEEIDEMAVQLSHILDHFDELRLVDTEGVPPTTHVEDLQSVLREDVAGPSLAIREVLTNAPQQHADQFRVDLVIDQ